MEQKLEYINDDKILVRKVQGVADFDEIYCSWLDVISKNRVKPTTIGIINDFVGAELDMKIIDVKKLISLFESNIEVFGLLRIAVVVDSYKNIVFPMVGNKFSAKINVRPFSTYETAHDWVMGIIE